jgi:hypothetical protein
MLPTQTPPDGTPPHPMMSECPLNASRLRDPPPSPPGRGISQSRRRGARTDRSGWPFSRRPPPLSRRLPRMRCQLGRGIPTVTWASTNCSAHCYSAFDSPFPVLMSRLRTIRTDHHNSVAPQIGHRMRTGVGSGREDYSPGASFGRSGHSNVRGGILVAASTSVSAR